MCNNIPRAISPTKLKHPSCLQHVITPTWITFHPQMIKYPLSCFPVTLTHRVNPKNSVNYPKQIVR